MNHLYPTTGIPTHAIHPFTRLPWVMPERRLKRSEAVRYNHGGQLQVIRN